MKLRLIDKQVIALPLELTLEERMNLATTIINNSADSFTISDSPRADSNVKVRLDILGTYILNAVKDIRDDVLSKYKLKRRPYQERPISSLNSYKQNSVQNTLFSNNDYDFKCSNL